MKRAAAPGRPRRAAASRARRRVRSIGVAATAACSSSSSSRRRRPRRRSASRRGLGAPSSLRDDASSASLFGIGGHAVGAGDERGLELVDLARGVLELAGQVAHGCGSCGARGPRFWARRALRCLARCRSRATADLRASGSPGGWCAAAPPAVLAQRDAIGVVALGLVRLVVAPLALLASEGDSDAHVSAGHVAAPCRGGVGRPTGPGQRKTRPGRVKSECSAITGRRAGPRKRTSPGAPPPGDGSAAKPPSLLASLLQRSLPPPPWSR